MNKPVLVYLDTQDYLNILYENGDGANTDTLSVLLEMRDNKKVVLGFSFAVVAEFLTKPDLKHREERVRRGALLKRICGTNTFPFLSDLANGLQFPTDGLWLGAGQARVVKAKKFKRDLDKQFEHLVGSHEKLNRSEKRRIRSIGRVAFLEERGLLTHLSSSSYGDIPVSKEIVESRIVERFIKGRCSDQEFEERMNRWLFDPEEYCRLVYDYADKPNMLDTMLGETKERLDKVMFLIEQRKSTLENLNSTLREARNKLIDSGLESKEAKRLTKRITIPPLTEGEFARKFDHLVGVGRSAHFVHYYNKISAGSYKPKGSDVMDLLHLCYAYDCDLFRCDKGMADVMKGFDRFDKKLVATFKDLPSAIEEASFHISSSVVQNHGL